MALEYFSSNSEQGTNREVTGNNRENVRGIAVIARDRVIAVIGAARTAKGLIADC